MNSGAGKLGCCTTTRPSIMWRACFGTAFSAATWFFRGIFGSRTSHCQVPNKARSRVEVAGRPLHDYVPLFINALYPMFEEHLRELGDELACTVVSSDVCGKPSVHFSDGNVAYMDLGTRIYCTPEGARRLPWDTIADRNGPDRVRGAEVLIPDCVEAGHIRYVFVTDPAAPTISARLPDPPKHVTYHRFAGASVLHRDDHETRELNEFFRKMKSICRE